MPAAPSRLAAAAASAPDTGNHQSAASDYDLPSFQSDSVTSAPAARSTGSISQMGHLRTAAASACGVDDVDEADANPASAWRSILPRPAHSETQGRVSPPVCHYGDAAMIGNRRVPRRVAAAGAVAVGQEGIGAEDAHDVAVGVQDCAPIPLAYDHLPDIELPDQSEQDEEQLVNAPADDAEAPRQEQPVAGFVAAATSQLSNMMMAVISQLIQPLHSPFFVAFVSSVFKLMGAMQYWVLLYNCTRHYLPYLMLCWFSGQTVSYRATEKVLFIITTVCKLFVGETYRFPRTVEGLIELHPSLARYCTIQPMILCPSCYTPYNADDCREVDAGQVKSRVCMFVEFPHASQKRMRQACGVSLLGQESIRMRAGIGAGLADHREIRLKAFAKDQFHYLGTTHWETAFIVLALIVIFVHILSFAKLQESNVNWPQFYANPRLRNISGIVFTVGTPTRPSRIHTTTRLSSPKVCGMALFGKHGVSKTNRVNLASNGSVATVFLNFSSFCSLTGTSRLPTRNTPLPQFCWLLEIYRYTSSVRRTI